MLKSWKFWLGFLLLSGLVWLVGEEYGWVSLLSAWQRVPPEALAVAVALMLVSYLLRAVRFFDFFMLRSQRHFVRLLRITVLHNFFTNLLVSVRPPPGHRCAPLPGSVTVFRMLRHTRASPSPSLRPSVAL